MSVGQFEITGGLFLSLMELLVLLVVSVTAEVLRSLAASVIAAVLKLLVAVTVAVLRLSLMVPAQKFKNGAKIKN